ncbi:MAG: c-type cytochrome [Pseudanabaenaceae cyanobacterium]
MGLVFAALLAIALFLTLQPKHDGYTDRVLALTGNADRGRAIFVMNCVACHGQWADGEVGPSLHGVGEKLSPQRLVHQVVSGQTPPMPQFQPSPQEMADLLSYLRKL